MLRGFCGARRPEGGGVADPPFIEIQATFTTGVPERQPTADLAHLKPLEKIPEVEAVESSLDHTPV